MRKQSLIIGLMMLFGSAAMAQNLPADLAKCSQTYLAEQLHLDYTVTNFNWEGKTSIQKGEIRKNKQNYYSAVGDEAFLVSGRMYISIDKVNRVLSYQKLNTKMPKHEPLSAVQIAQQLELADTIHFVGKQNGVSAYEVLFSAGPVVRMEIQLDTKGIKKIIYHYPKATDEEEYAYKKTVINYTKVSTVLLVNDLFKINKYLVKNGSSYISAKQFANYEVHKL
ncbi:MAG: hypothetical protein HRT57_14490 [Crocinitomicaceae bacterium]|nr:hypothetical protein [Crocinitomicaceae bacterium]